MKKILYLFTNGRKSRIEQIQAGKSIPLEFLYGVPYFEQRGYVVDILELNDLHPDPDSQEYQTLENLHKALFHTFRFHSAGHFLVESLERLNTYDVIIAIGEHLALGLAHFRRSGRLKPPVVFFVMGMLASIPALKEYSPSLKNYRNFSTYLYERVYNTRYRQGKNIYQELLHDTNAAFFLGKGEYHYACTLFPRLQQKLYFLPFAIDTDFWIPAEETSPSSYVLFMGNDRKRHFELLSAIARQLKHVHFKFITRILQPGDVPENVELLAGDWQEEFFSDIKIREFIQKSSFVILPLQDTLKPSGQSVALQAMACGKSIVISNTQGFWEPGTFIDRKHLWFVQSNSLDEWCHVIERVMNDSGLLKTMGKHARILVETNNHLNQFGERLEHIIGQFTYNTPI